MYTKYSIPIEEAWKITSAFINQCLYTENHNVICKDYNGYINDFSAANIFVTSLVFPWPMIILKIL